MIYKDPHSKAWKPTVSPPLARHDDTVSGGEGLGEGEKKGRNSDSKLWL